MPTTSLPPYTGANLQQGVSAFAGNVDVEYAHFLLISLTTTPLQSKANCVLPALGLIDSLIYLFVFVSPALTIFFFGLARVSDYVMSHTRLFYYLMTVSSVLLRVSVVLGIIGVCMYLFVGFLAPDSFQACSQFGA